MNKSKKCSWIIIWYTFKIIAADVERVNPKFAKVNNAANIYICGNNLYQKISQFIINEDLLDCNDKYLPIIFDMIKEKQKKPFSSRIVDRRWNS